MTEQINNTAISMVQAAALQMDPTKTASKDSGEKNDFQKLLEEKSKPTTPERKEQAEAEEKETVEPVKKKRLPLRKERLIPGTELIQIGQIGLRPGIIPTPQPVRPKMEIMGAENPVQMLSVENITEGKLITDEFAQNGVAQVVFQEPVQEPIQQEVQTQVQPEEEIQLQPQEEVQPRQAVETVQPSQTEQTEAPVEQAAPVHAEKAEARDSEEPEAEITEAEQAPQPVFQHVEAAPVKVGETYRAEDSRQADQPDVVNQIDTQLSQAMGRGESYVRIQLNPESLGTVTVEVSRSADGALRVALTAHSSETRNLLERHSTDLQGLLSSRTQQNVQVEVQRQQESQQGQNQHPYDGRNGHAQEQGGGQQHQRRQERSSQDFIQQLRLGLIPMDDDED